MVYANSFAASLLQLSIRWFMQIVLKSTYQPELTQGGLRKLTVSQTTTLKLKTSTVQQ